MATGMIRLDESRSLRDVKKAGRFVGRNEGRGGKQKKKMKSSVKDTGQQEQAWGERSRMTERKKER